MSKQDSVVIVSGVRTPMGGFQGSLSTVSAPELGSIVIKEAVERAGLKPEDVQEVIMGNVLPAGLKQGPARQAMRQAGLPDSAGATTINKLCGSGMKATMLAHDLIKAGTNDVMQVAWSRCLTPLTSYQMRVKVTVWATATKPWTTCF